MSFDWILFLGISIIGPYFGGKMCAAMEKKIAGGVRSEARFRKKRMRSALLAIVISYIVTIQIMVRIDQYVAQDLGSIFMRGLSILIGVNVYLIFQRMIYRILLLRA